VVDDVPIVARLAKKIKIHYKKYSLVPNKCFTFKFYPTKSVGLDCSEFHLMKAMSGTKKKLYRERYRDNQMLK
jgi:hypothetical protein